MDRRSVWGLLLLAALVADRSAAAQYLNPPARGYVTEDEAVFELGVPAGARLRGDSALTRRPMIRDEMIQRAQFQGDVQLDDRLPPTERGELNASPPSYERYSAT